MTKDKDIYRYARDIKTQVDAMKNCYADAKIKADQTHNRELDKCHKRIERLKDGMLTAITIALIGWLSAIGLFLGAILN